MVMIGNGNALRLPLRHVTLLHYDSLVAYYRNYTILAHTSSTKMDINVLDRAPSPTSNL